MQFNNIKSKFPIFKQKIKGKPLITWIVLTPLKNQKWLLMKYQDFMKLNFQMSEEAFILYQ